MSNKYKKLYEKIYNITSKIFFVNDLSVEECAISIYLTALGVRPACAPFDGDSRYGGMYGLQMFEKMTKTKIGKNALEKLGKISKLKIIIGPYLDVHNTILVINKDEYSRLKPLLEQISNISGVTGKKDILIGKMLGYVCPNDLGKIHKMMKNKIPLYNVKFIVNKTMQMPCWCLYDMKYIKKSIELLNKMKSVLEKIDKSVELTIEII